MTPKIEKVVLNMGLGLDGADAKILKAAEEDMGKITGQKPVITKFKKSVANFKTRKGSNAGLKVTLRKNKMYEFIDRLVNIALPRIKDFRGLSSKGFDKFGNYNDYYWLPDGPMAVDVYASTVDAEETFTVTRNLAADGYNFSGK